MLRLVGDTGALERERYLAALGRDVTAGTCSPLDAVDELHELSGAWMQAVIQARQRKLPPSADPHTMEHSLWMQWHGALQRFDPARVDTFSGYVALRLRIALVDGAREADPLPRRERARVKLLHHAEHTLAQARGRPLTGSERQRLVAELWAGAAGSPAPSAERYEPVNLELAERVAGGLDPADQVLRALISAGVREAITTSSARNKELLLQWLGNADGHSRLPPQRLTEVSRSLRAALEPWSDLSFTG